MGDTLVFRQPNHQQHHIQDRLAVNFTEFLFTTELKELESTKDMMNRLKLLVGHLVELLVGHDTISCAFEFSGVDLDAQRLYIRCQYDGSVKRGVCIGISALSMATQANCDMWMRKLGTHDWTRVTDNQQSQHQPEQ